MANLSFSVHISEEELPKLKSLIKVALSAYNSSPGRCFLKSTKAALPVWVDQLPEGVILRETASKTASKKPTGASKTASKTIRKPIPDNPPEDFFQRLELSLGAHQIPEVVANQVMDVCKLHPEASDNPNNYNNLLSRIFSSSATGR